jgi:uncharacterized protein YndB with AHSA1/START domain
MTDPPNATAFTAAPLRNRMRAELDAPVAEVWALLGDLTRLPEYSAGLERVEERRTPTGARTEYVCHFKPQADGGPGVAHRELIRWYEPNRGYASRAEEPNAFGLTDALTLVTLEPSQAGTSLTWDQYYDAGDLDTNRAAFDHALGDIAERLVARFGGRVAERQVDGLR